MKKLASRDGCVLLLLCVRFLRVPPFLGFGCPNRKISQKKSSGQKRCELWKLKPGFINRVLVTVIFEASKCF